MRKLVHEEIYSTRPRLDQLNQLPRLPMYCLVENVRSLYNVGSIFRTSDGVRLSKLFLTGYTGKPPRKEIDKTALGAVDSVPWEHIVNPYDAACRVKEQGISLVALEHTSKSKSCFDYDFPFPFCLMLGHEVGGLSEDLVRMADDSVEIPMYGMKQSLNVAVAYGVVIYHAVYNYLKRFNPPDFDAEYTVARLSKGQINKK